MSEAARDSAYKSLCASHFGLRREHHLALYRKDMPVLPEDDAILRARSLLVQSLPESGTTENDWTEHLLKDIAPGLNGASMSPNYYGFVTGGCTPAALFADMLASTYDQNVQVHLPGQTIATDVEVCALNMLLDLFRLDRDVWGASPTFTTGATASNILGLAMGREWVLRRRMEKNGCGMMSVGEHGIHQVMKAAGVEKLQILSTMPHSSIAKAASILGIGRANVGFVGKRNGSKDFLVGIDFDLLEDEVKRPHVASMLAVTAGEINTGRFATDGLAQMKRLRDICDQHNIWIHVDGAFGLFGRIFTSYEDRKEFGDIVRGCQGFELADSIAGDGHKLLNVPYDCGFYFCRHKGIADEVFRNENAVYLTSTGSDNISSPLHIGIENSRRFRALPVYNTLLAYGRKGYTDILRRQITLARRVVAYLWDNAAYEVLPEASSKIAIVEKTFMIVLFRAKDENLNNDLVRRINATRKIYVSGTVWEGRPAARIAIANWGVEVERDHETVLNVLGEVAK